MKVLAMETREPEEGEVWSFTLKPIVKVGMTEDEASLLRGSIPRVGDMKSAKDRMYGRHFKVKMAGRFFERSPELDEFQGWCELSIGQGHLWLDNLGLLKLKWLAARAGEDGEGLLSELNTITQEMIELCLLNGSEYCGPYKVLQRDLLGLVPDEGIAQPRLVELAMEKLNISNLRVYTKINRMCEEKVRKVNDKVFMTALLKKTKKNRVWWITKVHPGVAPIVPSAVVPLGDEW